MENEVYGELNDVWVFGIYVLIEYGVDFGVIIDVVFVKVVCYFGLMVVSLE